MYARLELSSHPRNKLDRLPFAMFTYHIAVCSDLGIKLEYLNVCISRWTLFTSTYRVGLSSYLQQVGLFSYMVPRLYISLDCLHINVSVWAVFTTARIELDCLDTYTSSCTVIISMYQAACLPTYVSE